MPAAFATSKDDFIADHPGPRLDAYENYLSGLISTDRAPQIRFLRTAMRLDPHFTRPAFVLGMIYFNDRDYPTSVLWLSKLQRQDTDYLEANYFLGLAYLYQNQYERSAAAFRVVAQQLPLNEVYNNLGVALMRQGRPGAVSYFEKAVQSDPSDLIYRFNLGYALWKQDGCVQALPHLRRASQASNYPAGRAIYIQCLETAGQTDEAARQQQLLQQQAPEWSRVSDRKQFDNLSRPKDKYDGSSFRQLEMLKQVQTELRHSKLPLQEHVQVHFQRAQQLLKEGLDRQAMEELRRVADYDPQNVEAYIQLATIYINTRRFEEAIRAASQSLKRKETPEGYLLLAHVYLELGKLEDVKSQLDAALRLDPANVDASALLEELNSKIAVRQ